MSMASKEALEAAWRALLTKSVLRIETTPATQPRTDAAAEDLLEVTGDLSFGSMSAPGWFDGVWTSVCAYVLARARTRLAAQGFPVTHGSLHVCVISYLLDCLVRVDDTERSTPYAVQLAVRACGMTESALMPALDTLRAGISAYVTLLTHTPDVLDTGVEDMDAVGAQQVHPFSSRLSHTRTHTHTRAQGWLLDALLAPPAVRVVAHAAIGTGSRPRTVNDVSLVLGPIIAEAKATNTLTHTLAHMFTLLSAVLYEGWRGADAWVPLDTEDAAGIRGYPGGQMAAMRDATHALAEAAAGRTHTLTHTHAQTGEGRAPEGAAAAATGAPTAARPRLSLTDVDGWRDLLHVLTELCASKDCVSVLVDNKDAQWSAVDATRDAATGAPMWTGKDVEQKTFLGRILSAGPQRSDFIDALGDAIAQYRDLPRRGDPRMQQDEDGEDAEVGDPSGAVQRGVGLLLPAPVPAAEVEARHERASERVKAATERIRAGLSTFLSYVRRIVDSLAKKGGRDALFAWYGLLLQANADRSKMGFTHMQSDSLVVKLSSTALLCNALHALLPLLQPFIDPSDPKCARIDLRYLSSLNSAGGKSTGNGRFDTAKEAKLAPYIDLSGNATDADDSQVPSWIDARNHARQQQFLQRQAALMRESTASTATPPRSSPLPPPSLQPQATPSPLGEAAVVAFSPIAEMYGLSVRLAHLGPVSTFLRMNELSKLIGNGKRARGHAAQQLRRLPNGGLAGTAFAPQVAQMYMQWRVPAVQVDRLAETFLIDELLISDGSLVDELLKLYRLHAVVMTRAACPPFDRHVSGVTQEEDSRVATPLLSASTPGVSASPMPALALDGGAPQLTRSPGLTGRAAGTAMADMKVLPLPVPKLPLPPPKAVLCGMPEYALSDVADFLLWVARTPFAPRGFFFKQPKQPLEDVLKMLVVYTASPLHVHNPYLRGRLVRALQLYIPHPQEVWRANLKAGPSGRVAVPTPPAHLIINDDPVAVQALLPAVAAFHVDFEFSGSHTVFYDKFQYRQSTADLMEYLWDVPAHRATLVQFAHDESSAPKFLRFANVVINDLSYQLEEALKSLASIKELEREQANVAGWAALSDEDRNDRNERSRRDAGMARMMLHYAMEQARLLALITSSIKTVWLSRDQRDHVANALGFFLDQLVGEKRASLAVRDRAKLGFNPIELLLHIVTVYNHLADAGPLGGADIDERASAGNVGTPATDIFASAIVRDARSYHLHNFEEAARVLQSSQAASVATSARTEGEKLLRLVPRLKAAEAAASEDDSALGDVPEEFQDEIYYDIARDPVMLPSSRKIADRAVITRSLLDNEQDPFTRQRLTVDMLIPMPELKAAVDAWIAARRRGDMAAADQALADARRIREMPEPEPAPAPSPVAAAPPPAPSTAEHPRTPAAEESERAPASGVAMDVDDDDELQTALRLSMAAADAAPPAQSATSAARVDDEDRMDEDLQTALQLSMGGPAEEDPELAEALRLSMQ